MDLSRCGDDLGTFDSARLGGMLGIVNALALIAALAVVALVLILLVVGLFRLR